MSKIDEILEHHGVRGMHWGIRRSSSGGTSVDSSKLAKSTIVEKNAKNGTHTVIDKKTGRMLLSTHRNVSVDAQTHHTLKKKISKHGLASLSNEELKVVAARLQLEQNYARAAQAQPTETKKKAKGLIRTILTNEKDTQLRRVVGFAATAAVNQALGKAASRSTAGPLTKSVATLAKAPVVTQVVTP